MVIAGLAMLFATGLLLFAADVDTFLPSRMFWIKMGLVALLLANGAMMRVAQHQAERGDCPGLVPAALDGRSEPRSVVPDGAGRERHCPTSDNLWVHDKTSPASMRRDRLRARRVPADLSRYRRRRVRGGAAGRPRS